MHNMMNREEVSNITSDETPSGLRILEDLNRVEVIRHFSYVERMGYLTQKKYKIFNRENKQQILNAEEHSNIDTEFSFRPDLRSFEISISNGRDEEILRLSRNQEHHCCRHCCWCCCLVPRTKIEVHSSRENFLGTIKHLWTCGIGHPKIVVKDSQGKAIFKIKGPRPLMNIAAYPVKSAEDGMEVGTIERKMGGYGSAGSRVIYGVGLEFKQDLNEEVITLTHT